MLSAEDNKREQRALETFEALNSFRQGKYQIVKRIDSDGCFSSVYELKSADGEELIMKAVDTMYKDIKISPQEVIRYTEEEISAMKECKDCEYVMDLVDAFDHAYDEDGGDHVYLLIMPKLQTCKAYFEACNFNLTEIIRMAKDICKALDYCHSHKILHRDVKHQNIYYSLTSKHFVLSDFGISRTLVDHNAAVTQIGSLLAPEIQMFHPLNGRFNSDIFSLGMTMLILNAGSSANDADISLHLSRLHTKVKEIMLKAIEGDPAKRYQKAADFYNELCKAEKIVNAAEVNKPEVEDCVDAFMKGEYQKALEIAHAGCTTDDKRMLYLYSYLLVCGGKMEEGMGIIAPLAHYDDPVATGMYGIIGHLRALKEKDDDGDKQMLGNIEKAAHNGFCIAQYFVGRWSIENEFGFPKNTKYGCDLLFKSAMQGFRPAMYLFKTMIERQNIDSLVSFQPFLDLINIELKDYSKDRYPADVVRVLANC